MKKFTYNLFLYITCMNWAKGTTEFVVGITHNVQRRTSYSYIPKPILKMLGNPKKLRFTIKDGSIIVDGVDK